MAQTTTHERPTRFLEAFNPRVPLYRDAYNEYLMFIVSAIGSVAGTQVPLYLVMALTDLWSVWVFVPACVVFELFVIFFIARPQMKPHERVGWALSGPAPRPSWRRSSTTSSPSRRSDRARLEQSA